MSNIQSPRRYKKPRQTFNASHTFPIRNRCNNCGQAQFEFYRDATNANWPASLKWKRNRYHAINVIGWVLDTNQDYIRQVDPIFRNRRYYAHSIGFKEFDPRLFRTFSTWDGRYPMGSDVIMAVCGNCGVQRWGYMTDRKHALPENANRKARIRLPVNATVIKSKFW
jgi:predicted  nucleic acid-binding Zn-ribbon protein